MAMKTVTAKGYTRVIRVGQKLVEQVLPDLAFKVCNVCGHWQNSGAALRCECKCHEANLPEEKV